ncbi:ABC transporter ATP-binding protein [Kutzneria viridogrisea]|uniref:ABC transporter ATP-binding protein n=1 Tax=Kutzneria TaxID=43356 RepID=UPI00046D49CC
MLDARGLRYEVGGQAIVRDVSLAVARGEVVGLVGPNGSGKTTVLRSVFRALRPTGGAVWLAGEDLFSLPPKQVARRMSVVAQDSPMEFDFTVREVVTMGRFAHEGGGAQDAEACQRALDLVGLTELADRSVLTLSGGERQRALIARALAQNGELVVLDEPTNHLDIGYQHELMRLLTGLGMTAVAALHDLNLAAGYCDRIYVLRAGLVVAAGTPEQVLTEDLVEQVFGVRPHLVAHPASGRPQLLFPSKENP